MLLGLGRHAASPCRAQRQASIIETPDSQIFIAARRLAVAAVPLVMEVNENVQSRRRI
jgi:hypothetical protein